MTSKTARKKHKAKNMDEQCRKRVRLAKGIWLRCQLRVHDDDNHLFDSPIRLTREGASGAMSAEKHESGTEAMKCRKCGSADIYTDWHKSEDDCGYSSSRRFSMPKGEHLHHSCRGCHFQWSSQPLDAVGRQPEEGEAKR